MFKYLVLPLIVAGALLVPAKPAAAYRGYYGYGNRGPRVVVRPNVYYGPRRGYIAPRVIVRPSYYRPPVYAAPYNYNYNNGYQQNGYYQSYGW